MDWTGHTTDWCDVDHKLSRIPWYPETIIGYAEQWRNSPWGRSRKDFNLLMGEIIQQAKATAATTCTELAYIKGRAEERPTIVGHDMRITFERYDVFEGLWEYSDVPRVGLPAGLKGFEIHCRKDEEYVYVNLPRHELYLMRAVIP